MDGEGLAGEKSALRLEELVCYVVELIEYKALWESNCTNL